MTVVNYETGEIATIDTSSEVAVTGYLQQARDWLATAVESTGPEQIAAAKAEIATAAEATKQLGLSKEIQDDAAEMVRRAEWTLRKATRKAQDEGTIAKRGTNLMPGARTRSHADLSSSRPDLPSPKSFFSTQAEYEDALVMGDAEDHEFEAALTEARAEGNLSRANVVRKLKPQRATRRAPLTDFAFEASTDLLKVAERLTRVLADDRFKDNRNAISQQAGGQINRSLELISQFSGAINSETTP